MFGYRIEGKLESLQALELTTVRALVFGGVGAAGLYAFKQGVALWKGAQWVYFGKEPQLLKQVLETASGDIGKLCVLFTLIDTAAKIGVNKLFKEREDRHGDRNANGLFMSTVRLAATLYGTHKAAQKLAIPFNLYVTMTCLAIATLLCDKLDEEINITETFVNLVRSFNNRLAHLGDFTLRLEKGNDRRDSLIREA